MRDKEKSNMVLGKCPECGEGVKTRDTFDILVWQSHADFIGDRSFTTRDYVHRACNTLANHSKD